MAVGRSVRAEEFAGKVDLGKRPRGLKPALFLRWLRDEITARRQTGWVLFGKLYGQLNRLRKSAMDGLESVLFQNGPKGVLSGGPRGDLCGRLGVVGVFCLLWGEPGRRWVGGVRFGVRVVKFEV